MHLCNFNQNKMTFKVKISLILCIFALLLASPRLTIATMGDVQQFNKGLENFGISLFSELAAKNPRSNVVFSPFSIQTCLTMARMGAEGQTADEIDQVLALSAQKPEELANNYHPLLAQYVNSSILKIANKIYSQDGYEIHPEFNELLTKQFFSSVESLNFVNSVAAAHTINSWVESKTNNLIKDLVSPNLLDANTRLVLVNAIHFKGDWVHQFPERGTREMDFYLDDTKTIKVQMMHTKESFKYADLPDLDATALELPYKNSDLSMLIVLPNKRTGLVELEYRLKNISLSAITQQMYSTKVIVDLPKFKAEFQAELSESLQKMGIKRMFSKDAEFGKMLKSSEGLQVSSVIHKAFIEVNEKGTEAAAATGMLIRKKRSLEDFTEIKEFNVEHPFVFKILQKTPSETTTPASTLVLFAGKIEQITENVLPITSNEIKDEL